MHIHQGEVHSKIPFPVTILNGATGSGVLLYCADAAIALNASSPETFRTDTKYFIL